MLRQGLIFVLFTVVLGAREADRVTTVPHLNGPQPTFKNYAGFLQATGTRKHFYWFVESEGNPSTDPVVLWLNGGPGCSSLTGKLVELGPWRVRKDGSGLDWFEQRWNKLANIIFMESPAGVGFSHSGDGNWTSSDDKTAEDNHEAMKDFFRGFPEFKNNDFYITGESYAGIYVPTLAVRIQNDADFKFKGVAIGNSVTDRRKMTNSNVAFTYGRGIIGDRMMSDLLDHCCVDRNATNCEYYNSQSAECQALMADLSGKQWSDGLNPYNLYQDCFGGVPDINGVYSEDGDDVELLLPDQLPLTAAQAEKYLQFFRDMVATHTRPVARVPCTDMSDRENYLNKPEVRAALHVPAHVQFWTGCSSMVSANYTRQYTDVAPQYLAILAKGHRILNFNGDLDQACNHLGNYHFVRELNQPMTHPYRTWTYNTTDRYGNVTQIAGWSEQYQRLKVVQVKGAGHFVPTDQPEMAYTMWEKFLKNEDF